MVASERRSGRRWICAPRQREESQRISSLRNCPRPSGHKSIYRRDNEDVRGAPRKGGLRVESRHPRRSGSVRETPRGRDVAHVHER